MGPLQGVKVVENAGLGPAPFTGMMLAYLGADVILVERKTTNPNAIQLGTSNRDFSKRGKKSNAVDLKKPASIELILKLVEESDVFIEGFRPGAIERLGLGPEVCLKRNPSLVYGRMTGWGQTGPLAQSPGHDINYIAITGAVHSAKGETPFTPATMVGDVGAGALPLALGITSALLYARTTGKGQVIGATICDGAIYNQTLLSSLLLPEQPTQTDEDISPNDAFVGAAHWVNSYACADGRYITVQAVEPNLYQELVKLTGFSDDPDFAKQYDTCRWKAAKKKLTELFASKPQSHWCELLEGTDACFAAVLTFDEAA
jgi:alpha-methylacyl-CoA racemase